MQEELNTHYEYNCKAEAVYVETLLKNHLEFHKKKWIVPSFLGKATKYHTSLCDRRLVERRESFHVQKSDTICSYVGTCINCLWKRDNNNDDVPNNNETPMENVEDQHKDITPDVNDGQTGPNMDGLENNGGMVG